MFGEKDSSISSGNRFDGLKSKLVKQSESGQDLDNPDEKIGFSNKGFELPGESKPSNRGNLSSKELTLSYLCEAGKMDFKHEKNLANFKGKEVGLDSTRDDDERWVVRDFLQLSGGSSKREIEDECERERNSRDKKAKMETLNLSLALPNVSLTLNTAQNLDPQPQIHLNPSRSVQSLATSNNMTQTTCSDDFTGASLSYSYSHQFSHNPSCSLTRNSTENYEYSVGSHNKIWNCGEGTNGSVHSRFRPVGDGVELAGGHGGGSVGHSLMHGSRSFNKDMSNSLYKAACSNSNSFFPSELPARPRMETFSADSRGKESEKCRVLDAFDDRTNQKLYRIVLQCVSESIVLMAQIFQELPPETAELTKEYLRSLLAAPHVRNELVRLQNQLERRSDITKESLSKSHRLQLEILVAVKFGLAEFLSQKTQVPTAELIELLGAKYSHCMIAAGSGKSDSLAPNTAQKDIKTNQTIPTKETIPLASSNHLSLSTTSSLLREMLPRGDLHVRDLVSKSNDGFESLESVVRIKEAEARMFQIRAEEARKEAERYHQMARVRAEKLDEEYAEKLAKLCLQETEQRRMKKMEELKLLENSHCDYYNMKIRMQADIAGLLERMESTKQEMNGI
ncbi:hypothetical protein V2J09_020550 [Rumex salicifolius]